MNGKVAQQACLQDQRLALGRIVMGQSRPAPDMLLPNTDVMKPPYRNAGHTPLSAPFEISVGVLCTEAAHRGGTCPP